MYKEVKVINSKKFHLKFFYYNIEEKKEREREDYDDTYAIRIEIILTKLKIISPYNNLNVEF